MALKYRIAALTDVAENLRALYKEATDGSGGFILDSDFKDQRLDEFRNNNRTLHTENEALKTRLEALKDVDPEEYKKGKALLDKMADEEEKRLMKDGKIDEVVGRRVAAAISDKDNQIKALQTQIGTKDGDIGNLRGRLNRVTVEREVQLGIEKAGVKVRQGALPDILTRAGQGWKVDEKTGKLVAIDGDGKQRFSSENADPLTMDEWIKKDMMGNAGHLFEGGGGGGASGGKGGGGSDFGGVKHIPNDPVLMGKHMADIAAGKVVVDMP